MTISALATRLFAFGAGTAGSLLAMGAWLLYRGFTAGSGGGHMHL